MTRHSKHPRSLGSNLIHGPREAIDGTAFNRGPVFASTFFNAGDPTAAPYQYGRYGSPNWTDLEATLGQLEDGIARVFPSGAAAVAATFFALCEPGDTVVIPNDAYFGTRSFASAWLERWGVALRFIPTLAMADADYEGVKLVMIESPSNPGLDVCDIRQVAERARAAGAIVVVDNTTPTPLGQQPLNLGADLSVSSDSKMLNGHSDVIFGHIVTRNDALLEPIESWRRMSGAIAGPMETWLVRRGLQTLELRHARQTDNAHRAAAWLNDQPNVEAVRYPGLSDDPGHLIASRQMTAFGCVVCFDLRSQARAESFLAGDGLIHEATSFGGTHTLAERRARWPGETAPPGLIRLSLGCEPWSDIKTELKTRLEAASQ